MKHTHVLTGIAALVLASGIAACGLRNLGETCPIGPVGDALCGPGVCGAKPGTSDQGECVECLNDLDCLKYDWLDRPVCVKGLPPGEGGDGRPFCKSITDHGSCNVPGGAVLCGTGKCHPDAGVCVDCLQDSDCPSSKPTCDPGVAPDNIPFCRE